jgi:hypothetical protein
MTEPNIRKAVPLSPLEVAALNALRTDGTPQREMLIELAGPRSVKSESTALHALVRLGMQAVEDHLLDQAYQRMAAERSDEDLQYQRAILHRHGRSAVESA